MDSILMESQSTHQFNNFIGGNYETALDESLQTLLDSYQSSNVGKSSDLTSKFGELLQCKISPPLETIWVHSALVFQERNSSKNEPLNRCAAIKDLFQLVASHSAACDSLISILLMSPVIYRAHKFIVDLKGSELKSKKEKKSMKEMRRLVDSVIGYVNMCSEGLDNNVDSAEGLIRPLNDLISIWLWDVKEKGGEDGLKLFFPLLGNEVIEKIIDGSCGLGELAGYVISEAFLLKCCLFFHGESSPKELQNELKTWAIGSITGLRSSYFFDSLLRLLQGSSLSVASLLVSDDEIKLREALYDAVALVEYSFLNPERMVHLPAKHAKSTALGRLIVTHEAVEFFRKRGNQSKVLSCINAFASSSLPSQLIRFMKVGMGIKGDASEPNGSSPKAFLRWILDIENRGLQVFDEQMSAYRAKLVLDHQEDDSKLSAYREKNSDADLLFYIDNKGDHKDDCDGDDEKMAEAASASFVNAARSLQSAEHGGKKRKSGNVEKKNRLKFLKYNLYEDSALPADKSTVDDTNNLSSGSDVENPTSDEDDR